MSIGINFADYTHVLPLILCGVICGFARILREDHEVKLRGKIKIIFISTVSALVVYWAAKLFIDDVETRMGLGCAVAMLGIDGVLKILKEAKAAFIGSKNE